MFWCGRFQSARVVTLLPPRTARKDEGTERAMFWCGRFESARVVTLLPPRTARKDEDTERASQGSPLQIVMCGGVICDLPFSPGALSPLYQRGHRGRTRTPSGANYAKARPYSFEVVGVGEVQAGDSQNRPYRYVMCGRVICDVPFSPGALSRFTTEDSEERRGQREATQGSPLQIAGWGSSGRLTESPLQMLCVAGSFVIYRSAPAPFPALPPRTPRKDEDNERASQGVSRRAGFGAAVGEPRLAPTVSRMLGLVRWRATHRVAPTDCYVWRGHL